MVISLLWHIKQGLGTSVTEARQEDSQVRGADPTDRPTPTAFGTAPEPIVHDPHEDQATHEQGRGL